MSTGVSTRPDDKWRPVLSANSVTHLTTVLTLGHLCPGLFTFARHDSGRKCGAICTRPRYSGVPATVFGAANQS